MARSAGEITIDDRELMSAITMNIRMPRLFWFRMYAATRLFALAGWITGMNVVVEVDDQNDD
jgi:hypothetical protein